MIIFATQQFRTTKTICKQTHIYLYINMEPIPFGLACGSVFAYAMASGIARGRLFKEN